MVFKYPSLMGFNITSLWPAVISPNPRIMIGVIEMTVIMIMDV